MPMPIPIHRPNGLRKSSSTSSSRNMLIWPAMSCTRTGSSHAVSTSSTTVSTTFARLSRMPAMPRVIHTTAPSAISETAFQTRLAAPIGSNDSGTKNSIAVSGGYM